MSRPQKGARDLEVDSSNGFIKTEQFTALPSSYVVQRTGDRPGLLALTFDDGPDPRWTPAILDILKQENVPATFFIIGKNGQAYPELVRRIADEGHANRQSLVHTSEPRRNPLSLTELELNATQRLIESEVGRSTVLFSSALLRRRGSRQAAGGRARARGTEPRLRHGWRAYRS